MGRSQMVFSFDIRGGPDHTGCMHPVRIGTCGWSYQDWLGVFYPKGLPAGEYLSYVAERYPVVEVDSTF
jgi:hypothetical protein